MNRDVPLHKPVLLQSFLETAAPISGRWVDCTFGAGSYSAALCEMGAEHVFGIDCDPDSAERGGAAAAAAAAASGKFTFCLGRFGEFDRIPDIIAAIPLQGVVFDLGVSSMQFDEPQRGFSLRRDGPLDMRMDRDGISAADIVNRAPETVLADIFFRLGEERASRRIARQIARRRMSDKITSTLQLAEIVVQSSPGRAQRRTHPATRVFQALRIAVNDELVQLAKGLAAAERCLCAGGQLAVISFHSLEDRIVKRFLRGAAQAAFSRPMFAADGNEPPFRPINRKPIRPCRDEIERNPRARSARLRVGIRTDAKPAGVNMAHLGVPLITGLEQL